MSRSAHGRAIFSTANPPVPFLKEKMCLVQCLSSEIGQSIQYVARSSMVALCTVYRDGITQCIGDFDKCTFNKQCVASNRTRHLQNIYPRISHTIQPPWSNNVTCIYSPFVSLIPSVKLIDSSFHHKKMLLILCARRKLPRCPRKCG